MKEDKRIDNTLFLEPELRRKKVLENKKRHFYCLLNHRTILVNERQVKDQKNIFFNICAGVIASRGRRVISNGLNQFFLKILTAVSKLKLFVPGAIFTLIKIERKSILTCFFFENHSWIHRVKSVQIRSCFVSLFSYIRTEYEDLLRKSPYSVRIQDNTDQK